MIQKVVGISFSPTSDERVKVGSPVEIYHDKDNQYSSRAIAVKFEDVHLGHIGEKGNVKHEEIFDVLPLKGVVCTMSRLGAGEEFSTFKEGEITHLEIEFTMSCDSEGLIKSFNEDLSLKFLKKEHRYVYEGKNLISATTYIKRWIAEFDASNIASVCANKYGCSQEDVLGLWDGSGDIAASFGTAIHNALEHYEKYRWLGEIIQNQKDLPFNKALPTHPVLRGIVEDFYKQDLQEGEVFTEALVTNVEKGLCGLVDRLLVTGEKKCRVQDYKVNIGAEEISSNNKYLGQMAVLPKNKLSKYALQMSFYARLLELSGWEVEGLDVFVYEDEWKHFELEIIKLDF